MSFPTTRLRRLRQSAAIRDLVRENSVQLTDLIMPYFVCPGTQVRNPISSMPGNYQLSVDELVKECTKAEKLGLKGILLFGIPEKKDEDGSVACHEHGIVQQALRALKEAKLNLCLIADVCNCEYTTHGHCGTIINGDVDNDKTLETLAKQAVSLTQAGADIIAPSDMMDGRVAAIREALDKHGHTNTPIMSYAAKFASAFYGPFREAADSTPQFGDRKTYQMDYANGDEALREIAEDIKEGADFVMVKPGLSFMDIVSRAKQEFNIPMVVYNVSGEFSMVKAAAEKGWIDEKRIVTEILTSFKRAGADLIITYHAVDFATWLQEKTI